MCGDPGARGSAQHLARPGVRRHAPASAPTWPPAAAASRATWQPSARSPPWTRPPCPRRAGRATARRSAGAGAAGRPPRPAPCCAEGSASRYAAGRSSRRRAPLPVGELRSVTRRPERAHAWPAWSRGRAVGSPRRPTRVEVAWRMLGGCAAGSRGGRPGTLGAEPPSRAMSSWSCPKPASRGALGEGRLSAYNCQGECASETRPQN